MSGPHREIRPVVQDQPDHWNEDAYSASASFVPLLTQEIVEWLDPQPNDIILDLGCGDGGLTTKIRSSCSRITGVDASANFITTAYNNHGTNESLTWNKFDCRYLDIAGGMKGGEFLQKGGEYTKVFSNAALHWILRDDATRLSVFHGAYRVLQPGGTLVFEMGGAGCVAEVHAAFVAALVHQGVGIEEARDACPWFFPSEESMRGILEATRFKVEKMKLEYRPTKLTTDKDGGLEGWLRLMGAQFLDVLDTHAKKEAVIREVWNVLQTVVTRSEDGSTWLGYVRLKVIARKVIQ